jgi:uncharacterized protein (DUF927 family)
MQPEDGVQSGDPGVRHQSEIQRVAASVWGGGGPRGFIRTWRATSNGLEAVALASNDALLCLDELSEISGREAGPTAYMLANGEGKARARRDGSGRPPARWLTMFISTGEISLAAKMAEAGQSINAGQENRLVDLAADAGGGHGIFDQLNGFANGNDLARHLQVATGRQYGTPIRAFLDRLAADRNALAEDARREALRFAETVCPRSADGQVQRVTLRFGLVAAAGSLASRFGILPWPANASWDAARRMFGEWLDQRGGVGSAETARSLRQLRSFVELHGESRFTRWDCVPADRPTHNRAGFRWQGEGRTEFRFLTSVMRAEVLAGLDFNAALQALRDARVLIADPAGKSSWSMRVPELGQSVRLYRIDGNALLGGEVSEAG